MASVDRNIVSRDSMALPYVGEVVVYSRSESAIDIIDETRSILVGYSTRNNRFSTSWFQKLFFWIKEESKKVIVVIVDKPYAYNDAAKIGESIPSIDMYKKSIHIGDERERMVYNVAKNVGAKLEIYRWGQLEGEKNIRLFAAECELAFRTSNRFKATLVDYVKIWKGEREFADIELAAEFLLQEIPVFAWWYYVNNKNVDMYPGKMFPIFWEIEMGHWRQELPIISRTAEDKTMIFISTEEKQSL